MCLSFGIEFNQIFRNIFYFLLCTGLFAGPFARTKFCDAGNFAFLTGIFLKLVQAGNIYIKNRIFLVSQNGSFLYGTANFNLFESRKFTDTVINVDNIIANIQVF